MTRWLQTRTDVRGEASQKRLRQNAEGRALAGQAALMTLGAQLAGYTAIVLPTAGSQAWMSMLLALLPLGALWALWRLAARVAKPCPAWRAGLLLPCLLLEAALSLRLLSDIVCTALLPQAEPALMTVLLALFGFGVALLGGEDGVRRACDLGRWLLPLALGLGVWLSDAQLNVGRLYPFFGSGEGRVLLAALWAVGGVWPLALVPAGSARGSAQGASRCALAVLAAATWALHAGLSLRMEGICGQSATLLLTMPLAGSKLEAITGLLVALCAVLSLSLSSCTTHAMALLPKAKLWPAAALCALALLLSLLPIGAALVIAAPARFVLAAGSLFFRGREGA